MLEEEVALRESKDPEGRGEKSLVRSGRNDSNQTGRRNRPTLLPEIGAYIPLSVSTIPSPQSIQVHGSNTTNYNSRPLEGRTKK